MNIRRIIIAGFTINVLSFIIGALSFNWAFKFIFQLEPTYIWRWISFEQKMGTGWWTYLIIGNTILAILFAWVYAILIKGIPGSGIKKGILYGILLWLAGILPCTFSMHIFTKMAGLVVLYWTIDGLIEYSLYGAIVAAIYGEQAKKNAEEG